MERMLTGVQGLDPLLQGGLPKGFSIMLNGPVGSYRDLLALEFLYRGAVNGENCIYLTFEKKEEDVREATSMFNWKLDDTLKSRNLVVVTSELFNFEQFVSNADDALFSYKATRLVVDSAGFLADFFKDDLKLRQALNELKNIVERHGTTAMFLDDVDQNDTPERVMDGVIETRLVETRSGPVHALAIRTMRSTEFSPVQHLLELGNTGLKVKKFPLVV